MSGDADGCERSSSFVYRLFHSEIPEIADGTVVIKAIAREAGNRTKMAVHTDIDNIDPVGACIGKNACRINNILSRIEPEKMDIIPWTNDPWEFVAGSLVPAGIVKIDPDHHEDHLSDVPKADPIGSGVAHVVVPKDHLHIALGENMVNLRLAEQLTGWKIRIRSED